MFFRRFCPHPLFLPRCQNKTQPNIPNKSAVQAGQGYSKSFLSDVNATRGCSNIRSGAAC
jgi:hypothetical protein